MTRPGSEKVQRQLAGQTQENQAKVDSHYLESSSDAPTYANVSASRGDLNQATNEPDYYELS